MRTFSQFLREESALEWYQSSGAKWINNTLRARGGAMSPATAQRVQTSIKELDARFRSDSDTAPRLVFRTMSSSQLAHLKVGDVFSDPAYLSVAADRNGARRFLRSGTEMIRIESNGVHVLDLRDLSDAMGDEHELLFPRNTRLKFLGVSPDGTKVFRALR